jgi:hypothetical protein
MDNSQAQGLAVLVVRLVRVTMMFVLAVTPRHGFDPSMDIPTLGSISSVLVVRMGRTAVLPSVLQAP